MDTTDSQTAQSPIVQLVFGFQNSQVIISATQLGIFDAIQSSESKSCSVKDICRQLDLDEECTGRVMRMCVCLGLLRCIDNGDQQDLFENTSETSRLLVSSSPTCIAGFVGRVSTWYRYNESLIDFMRNGQQPRFALDPADHAREDKIEYNTGLMRVAGPSLATAYDLSKYTSVCDLAGNIGAFALILKQTYPGMNVSVMEHPGIVDYALSKSYHLDNNGQPMVEYIKGDMFTSDLPQVDLFTITHACPMFPDDELIRLFSRIYSALPKDGAFMICEALMNDDKCGPILTSHRDMAELLLALKGERSVPEYRRLLGESGFNNIEVHVFKKPICYDVILAYKDNNKK